MTEEEHALLVKAAKHVSGLWGGSDDWERFMEEAEDYIDFARPEIEAPLRARIAELEALIADLRDALNREIKAKFYHKKAWQDEFMAHRATNDKQAARIAALEASGGLVVEWWLTEGMKVMGLAPYAIFKMRAVLENKNG